MEIISARKDIEMTKELMICKKIRDTKIKNGVLIPHQKYSWIPVEPNLLKDWIPFCSTFCNVDFEKNECSGMIVDGVVVDCCLKCPWYEGVKK